MYQLPIATKTKVFNRKYLCTCTYLCCVKFLHLENNNDLEVGDDDDLMICISKDVPKMQKLEQAGGRLIVSTKMQIVREYKNNIY